MAKWSSQQERLNEHLAMQRRLCHINALNANIQRGLRQQGAATHVCTHMGNRDGIGMCKAMKHEDKTKRDGQWPRKTFRKEPLQESHNTIGERCPKGKDQSERKGWKWPRATSQRAKNQRQTWKYT